MITSGREFAKRFTKYGPVLAAWVKDEETGAWHLYVYAPGLQEVSFFEAYEEVRRVREVMPEPKVGHSLVRLLRGSHRPAQILQMLRSRKPTATTAQRFFDQAIGFQKTAEEIYLYPSAAPEPAATP
jgi:hypothetical protein